MSGRPLVIDGGTAKDKIKNRFFKKILNRQSIPLASLHFAY